jgi:hypothetical protein
MSTLADTQREFMRAVFSTGEAAAGLQVYRASVMANFAAALAATYPVVRRLVGDEFFAAMANRFAREVPSRSGDLRDYGAELAVFLAAHPTAASLAYLPDVARLEWACHECEHAPPAPVFDFEALARVSPAEYARLRLTLDPSLRLLRSAHAIAAIHAANQPGRDGTPDRALGPDFVVVRRIDVRVRAEAVDAREWRLLEQIAQGEALADAVRAFSAEGEGASAVLARFVAAGIACGFTTAAACA